MILVLLQAVDEAAEAGGAVTSAVDALLWALKGLDIYACKQRAGDAQGLRRHVSNQLTVYASGYLGIPRPLLQMDHDLLPMIRWRSEFDAVSIHAGEIKASIGGCHLPRQSSLQKHLSLFVQRCLFCHHMPDRNRSRRFLDS